jgi:hypothetical protein
VYECALCGAATPVVVTGLIDPERALVFATCPVCRQRNPSGALEQTTSRRRTRVIGTIASAAVAVTIWFVPWLAFAVAAIAIAITTLVFVVQLRVRKLRWQDVVINTTLTALVIGVAWLYPRATALFPALLAVRFAVWRGADDSAWQSASEALRFEESISR